MSVNHNGIDWPDSTYFAKTMKEWNTPKSLGGKNRDGFEKYPQMLYKAQPNPLSNKYEVAIHSDVISLDGTRVLLDAEQFNARCQRVVKDENEFNRALSEGWRPSQSEAMEHYEALQNDIAVAAAERAAGDRKMSQKAQDEAARADVGSAHLTEIPEQPVKRRPGRPRKVQPQA